MKKICVIGSINVDLVTRVGRFPRPGETVIGKGFSTYPGGKGANQAVAAGRLGADVRMVAKVGDDNFGAQMMEVLKSSNVETESIRVHEGVSTGVACIQVADAGENSIVISYGANAEVTEEFISESKGAIDESDIVMLQLEIPLASAAKAIEYAASQHKIIILDPAPAQVLGEDVLKHVDILTPNETEIQTITGMEIRSEEDVVEASRLLLEKGVKKVINKAGKKGAYLITKDRFERFPTYDVKVVDTTAAGDSFNAGLAVGLAQGKSIEESIDFANLVAAVATTKFGAQSAMPTMEECNEFLKTFKKI